MYPVRLTQSGLPLSSCLRAFALSALRRAPCGVCCGGGHLLLRLVRLHLLAEEEGSHAWADLLQRADKQR